jgi:hypothetical protein
MTTVSDVELSNNFPLPELKAIGDAIARNLQLHSEEELLGQAVLSKVQALISRKQVTSEDVIRIALVCDALRVLEEAILADDRVSDVEATYALALVRDAAKRLATFRAYYAQHAEIGASGLRSFLVEHRADKQMFGGACPETRWLGLEISRQVGKTTGDRDPLDRYEELMVRLCSEVIALEPGQSSEASRARLDERLGLLPQLLRSKQEAERFIDPRVRTFCSPDSPDVFTAVEHATQVWTRDAFDVDSVHQAPRVVFSRLLSRASEQKDSGSGRVMLIQGDSGSGKTHLMRVFRNQVHTERRGYAGYMQLTGSPSDFGRYVLGRMIDSLEKPYDLPEVPESGLLSLSDTLLLAEGISAAQRGQLQEGELPEDDMCRLVFKLADLVVNEPRFASLDLDLVRALLFLQRREPRYHQRVVKYLRGEPLSRFESELLGELAPRSDTALQLMAAIGNLIACVDGGALVVLLDQLEDIYHQQAAKEQFVRLMDIVRQVADLIPNALVVVSCLTDLYLELRGHLTQSVLDRIERDPEPQRLSASRSLPELDAIVERRLSYLYESKGVRHRAEEPHFPIARALLDNQSGKRLRDALSALQTYRRNCIAADKLVAWNTPLVTVAPPEPSIPEPVADLTRQWQQFVEGATEVPSEEAQLELLSAIFDKVAKEPPQGVSLGVVRLADALQIDVPDRGEGSAKIYVSFANQTSRGGKLAKHVDAVNRAASKSSRTPVLVRAAEFGGAPGTALAKHLGSFAKAGGRRVVVDQEGWRRLLAFQRFSAEHAKEPSWSEWVRAERPLLKEDCVRAVLGYPSGGEIVFVGGHVPIRPSAKPIVAVPPKPEPVLPVISVSADSGNSNAALRIGTTLSVKQDPVHLELGQLKRHCAFLGASGSGKTSLALSVIEQAAQRGIGAILLDRKGDLAAFADPQCWDHVDPDPEREKLKRTLRERLHVRLFTPGNSSGRALGIRAVPPGLNLLPPQERSQLARFAAQGLGTMMGYKTTNVDQAYVAVLAKTIEVIGQLSRESDIGLRDMIGLLADEDPSLVNELGYLDLKVCRRVVNHLEVLRINHQQLLEHNDTPLSAELLLGRDGSVPKGKVPLTIISTKFLGGTQPVDFWVSQLLVELSRWSSRSPSSQLQALLFLDEADAYLPATSKPATKEPLQDLLKRARSAGLGVMLATQSPGDLDYKARDNIGTWWIGRIGSPTAIEKMKPLLSECRTDVSASLATSSLGEFFQVSDGQVLRMRSQRSLMETTQLNEERILSLARGQIAETKVVA